MPTTASFWKISFLLLFTAFLLIGGQVPAKAGLLDEIRQEKAQTRPKGLKARKAMRERQRREAAERRAQTMATPNEEPRFGGREEPTAGPRGFRRMSPQAEPASWQADDQDQDRWETRRGWTAPQDPQTELPEPQLASMEPQTETAMDPAAANRQVWDENNTAWTDTDQGTRPVERQEVMLQTKEAPGTIIINTTERRLYFVIDANRAIQYGIGVGRPGFEWAGVKAVTRKEEWPDWTPPSMMIKRRPDLPRYMPGGPTNPMGARAMYLGSSLYRIHGSNEPETIGQAVSSGCIRMINADVIDLYNRVNVGAKVVVR